MKLTHRVVAILDDDIATLRALERFLCSHGVEVFADHDPLRWLSIVTDLQQTPDLMVLDFSLGGNNCLLHVEILKRKWARKRPKILVITGCDNDPLINELAKKVPVLLKPIGDDGLDLILAILAHRRDLPRAGFLRASQA